MFADIQQAIDEADDDWGEDVVRAFQKARARNIAKFMKFSGKSQADAASEIGVSTTFVQKMISQPLALAKHLDSITTMLALPVGSISSPVALANFIKKKRVYADTIDAVIAYTSPKYLPTGKMPVDYIVDEIKRYLSANYSDQCSKLVAYFTSPASQKEPNDDDILAIEESLEVPVGAIRNPAEVTATRSQVNMLSLATRKKIAANIERIAAERKLSDSDIAGKAGVALVSITNLRGTPFTCTFALVVAVASALEVEPFQLMQHYIKADEEENHQPALFANLPGVSRKFISEYLLAVQEQRRGIPTARSRAALLATPFLQYAISLLSTYSSQMDDANETRDFGELLAKLEAKIRVGI
jgi:DNA-binding Xre family transcriptional regulator